MSARHEFLDAYQKIRMAEGRGATSSEYYRALPDCDAANPNAWQWQMRARTFDYLVRNLLPKRPCDILDLGAGNGWLSNRLRERGHRPVAVDIFSDPFDGLGAIHHYDDAFPAIEADFDSLPFPSAAFDLAIYNASIHYSSDYGRTIQEARRCLRPGGRVVILDSPLYSKREHGERMREERQRFFHKEYGFRSEALKSIEFFDLDTLRQLERNLPMRWEFYKPWYGWRWHLRPLAAFLKRRRPPSRFWIMVGHFT